MRLLSGMIGSLLKHTGSMRKHLCMQALFLLCCSFPGAALAQEFTATAKGDYDGVTVMEVSGNYDEIISGATNSSARFLITNEFYKTHQDEYDFIVILTNFDYAMQRPDDKAFFTGVKNDVLGIGQTIYDNSTDYGSFGRLQGMIEMGNITALESDSVKPGFEDTLSLLAHQMMHRWGGWIGFTEGGATSTALTAHDESRHWSYLLDTNGSVLYGNHWRNNNDGTFTSVKPTDLSHAGLGRIVSPLDLYLMGLIDKNDVPDMLLIQNQAIDDSTMPEIDSTISGTATTISINQIISANGQRTPTAANAQKNFRTAFIYLTRPQTFPDIGILGIEAIKNAWMTRFMVLTDGKGVMDVVSTPTTSQPTNPGVIPTTGTTRTSDDFNMNDGITWLKNHQQPDGRWEDIGMTSLRDTAETVFALKDFSAGQQNRQNGIDWIAAASRANTDYLARSIEALAGTGQSTSALVADLVSFQNTDGGWGGEKGFVSNPLDTGLALKSLAAVGSATDTAVILNAISYLQGSQNPLGGWGAALGQESTIQPTATVLAAFGKYRDSFGLNNDIIAPGIDWLKNKQDGDGGFGNSPGTVYDTATAVLALATLNTSTAVNNGLAFLRNKQSETGSWNESAYQTALAMRALWEADPAPVVLITAPSGTVPTNTPQLFYTVTPADATATVWVDGKQVNKTFGSYLDPLASGEHIVRVEATDGFNTGAAAVTFMVNSPIVTIRSPSNGVYSNATPTLLYHVDKPASVLVTVDTVTVNVLSGERLPALADGEHMLQIDATDAAGGTGHSEVTFIIYTTATGTQLVSELTGTVNLGSRAIGASTADKFGNIYVASSSCADPQFLMYVTKYDQQGNIVMETSLSSDTDSCQYPNSIKVDDDGTFYVTLKTLKLIKFDKDGVVAWTQWPVYTYDDKIYSVFIGPDGYIYVGGISNYGNISAYWKKYDKSGVEAGGNKVELGVYDFPNTSQVAADADGNVYMAGYTYGQLSNGNGNLTANSGGEDYFVVSYNKDSYLRWVYQGGTAYDDWATGIAVDDLGGVYVTGYTNGSLEGNTSQGGTDAFIAKFNSATGVPHVPLWAWQLGTDSDDYARAITAEKNGVIYVSGSTGGALEDAVGSGGIFVVKGDGSGGQFDPYWIKQFGTASGTGQDIFLSAPGHLFVRDGSVVYALRDPRLPNISIDQKKIITQTVSPTISGTVDSDAVVEVTAEPGSLAGITTYPSSGHWSSSFVNMVADGDYLVTATAKNGTGFRDYAYGAITLDTVAPAVTLTSPENGTTYYSKPTLSYIVDNGTVNVTVNGIVTLIQSGDVLDYLVPGVNTVRVEAHDEAGHVGSVEVVFSVDASAAGGLPYGPVWTKQLGAVFNPVEVTDMAVDPTGNSYLIGTTFDSSYRSDVSIIKYDSQGNLITPAWQIGALNDYDIGNGIVVDNTGKLHIARTKLATTGSYSVYIEKYNEYKASTAAWSMNLAFSSNTTNAGATDIAVDGSGNVIVIGKTDGTITGVSGSNGGESDFFIAKYTATGTRSWAKLSGLSGYDSLSSVATDTSGNILVTGQTATGPVVIKYSNSNNITSLVQLWKKQIFPDQIFNTWTNEIDSGNGIAIDVNGNVYVAGNVDFGNGQGQDIFIAKYDKNGNPLWSAPVLLGTASDDVARDVVVDLDGNVIVTGYTWSNFDGNINAGDRDVIIVKFDNNGNKIWSRQWGSSVEDFGIGIEKDGNGNILIGGNSQNYTTDFLSDVFLMKLAPVNIPSVSINAVTTPTYTTNQSISGTRSADTTVTVFVNTDATAGTVTYPTATTWSCTITGLIIGNNTITVKAFDNNDVFGTAVATVDLVDNEPPTGSISINNNAQYTRSPMVLLSLMASDAGGVAEMQLSNDGANWSAAETYGIAKIWTLGADDGTKEVYVRYKDTGGLWSNAFDDSIVLDTSSPAGSITVNNGASHTKNLTVTLTLNCSDVTSGCSQMQFSHNNSSWSTPEAYSTSKTWQVTPGDGEKTVFVKYIDGAGNRSNVAQSGITLDTVPPVTTASPTGGLHKTAINVTLSVSEPATIYYTTNGDAPTTASPLYAGPISITDTTTLHYFAEDAAGNREAVKTTTFTIDTAAPVLTLSALADGAYTNNATMNIAGTVTDNITVQGVTIKGAAVTINPDGTFSQVISLVTGSNSITTEAVDTAGNTTTDTRTITLSRTAPAITITDPADNSATNDGNVTITGSVENAASVTVKLNNGDPVLATLAGNAFNLPLTLISGLNAIEVTATDLAGYTGAAKRTVTVNNASPSLAMTSPVQDLATDQATIDLIGTVADLIGTTMVMTIDGLEYTPVISNGTFTATLRLSEEKAYPVIMTATDAGGNSSTVQRNIIYDKTPPALTIDPVTTPTNNSIQVISGSMELASAVTVTCATAMVGEVSYPTTTTWQAIIEVMTEGTNTLNVTATDQAGNGSTAATAIILDTIPPTGNIVINGGSAYITDATTTLTLSCSDSGSGCRRMEFSNDGGQTWPAAEDFLQSVIRTIPAGDRPDVVVHVRFYDLAGNPSDPIPSNGVILDTTPPVGTIAINNNAPYTNNTAVTLTLTASDSNGIAAMELSSDNGSTWTEPTLPVSQMTWTIPSGEGPKNVLVKYQDNAGLWSIDIPASTTLDTTPPQGIVFTKVVAGRDHVLGLKSDGSLWAWGGNANGQLGDGTVVSRTQPISVGTGTAWTAIAAGNYTSFSIKSDGTLWAWGDNSSGKLGNNDTTDSSVPVQIGAGNVWAAVAAGGSHAVALTDDGRLFAWGVNTSGQFGDESTTGSLVPVPIETSARWVAISAGINHTVALDSEGSLWAWGDNAYGQVGNETTENQTSPVLVATQIKTFVAGANHTLAIDNDGKLWAWGYNVHGELGLNHLTNKTSPQQVGSEQNWAVVGAGWYQSFALKTDGSLFAWGYNYRGELGDGTGVKRKLPVRIGTDKDWVALSGGLYHSAGLKSDGTVWIWGGDSIYGGINRSTPTLIGTQAWKTVAAGMHHTVAVQTNGTLWAWGYNYYGQLGINSLIDQPTSTVVGTSGNWTSVSAGMYHSAALNADGELWSWGLNNNGQLGDGTVTKRTAPVKIAAVDAIPWTSVSLGSTHSVALKQNGTIWAWGDNTYGQLCSGPEYTADSLVSRQIGTATNWIAVVAGGAHTIALNDEGELWACGYNFFGQLGDNSHENRSDLTPVYTLLGSSFSGTWMSVAAGLNHTLALDSNGRLFGWGNNVYGQVGNGTTNTRQLKPVPFSESTWAWDKMSGGFYHSLARRSDGTLWAWGFNGFGQLGGDGTTTDSPYPKRVGNDASWSLIDAGGNHTAGLKSDNTLWTWGYNGYGQLGEGSAPDKKAPSPVDTDASISINNAEPLTGTATVTLTLHASDTSGVSEMQLSNDGSWSSPDPVSYAEAKSWLLVDGNGKKTVYVRFRDNAGNWTGAFKDTILLETVNP